MRRGWVVWIVVVLELQRVDRSVRELKKRKKMMMVVVVLMRGPKWYLY